MRHLLGLGFPICNMGAVMRVLLTTRLNMGYVGECASSVQGMLSTAQPAEVQKCWWFSVAVVSPQSGQQGPCREPGVEQAKGSLIGDTAHSPGPTEAVLRTPEGTSPWDTRGALLPPSPPVLTYQPEMTAPTSLGA